MTTITPITIPIVVGLDQFMFVKKFVCMILLNLINL